MSRCAHTSVLVATLAGYLASATPGSAAECPGRVEVVPAPARPALDGQACMELRYGASDPDWVRLYRDDQLVLSYQRGMDIVPPPHAVCLPTDAIVPGAHAYRLEVSCEGDVARATATAVSRHRALGLTRIVAPKPAYASGDEVVLDLDVIGEAVNVRADFSAIDTGYRAGLETISLLRNGSYRIRYKLSAQNRRPAGVYPIGVVLMKGQTRQALPRAIELSYLPRGRTQLIAPDARFIVGVMPARPQTSGLIIEVARLEQPSRTPAAAPSSRSATTPSSSEVDTRQPFELRFVVRSPVRLESHEVDLELFDQARDGYWTLPLDPAAAACDAGGCRYDGRVALRLDRTAGDRGGHETTDSLAFRAVSHGSATPMTVVPGLGLTAKPFEHTHLVHGTIAFEYHRLSTDIIASTDWSDWPQYAATEDTIHSKPSRKVKIVLTDTCGHYIERQTDDLGHFSIEWTPAGCASASLTVFSMIDAGNKHAAVGRWLGEPMASICDLTGVTQDYVAHSQVTGFTISSAELVTHPEGRNLDITVQESVATAKALYILDNVFTALEYYDDIEGVSTLPKLNVVYSPGLKPADWEEPAGGDCDWQPGDDGEADNHWDGEWARYVPGIDPGFIFIPAEAYIDYGWTAFAHVHETAHYFHRHYVRSSDYGRFGEPLADAQAGAILGTRWMNLPWISENMDLNASYGDRDEDGTSEFWQADMTFGENVKMGWAWRLMFDLLDPGASDPEPLTEFVETDTGDLHDFGEFDTYSGGAMTSVDADNHKILDVLMHYLGGGVYGVESADYQDRGLDGPDLVDLLDGMLCRDQITEDALDSIANDAMGYGYDFGVAVGSCQ